MSTPSNDGLKGNPSHKEGTRIKATFSRMQELKRQIDEFNIMIERMDEQHLQKKENLRLNRRIDDKIAEYDRLHSALVDPDLTTLKIPEEEQKKNEEMLENFFKNYNFKEKGS